MTVGFRASFAKDLETIHDARLLGRVAKVILALERAESLGEVPPDQAPAWAPSILPGSDR